MWGHRHNGAAVPGVGCDGRRGVGQVLAAVWVNYGSLAQWCTCVAWLASGLALARVLTEQGMQIGCAGQESNSCES